MERINRINTAVEYLQNILGDHKPIAGIVLGSGLGKLADFVENPIVVPYSDIPGFPLSTVMGHKGNFVVGTLGGKPVVAMQGRFHFYEGHHMDLVTLPIRVMVKLGISYLFVSNAAGGCNPEFNVGDLMIIKDHINLITNPLIGKNMDEFGPRFPDMTAPYDLGLIARAEVIAAQMGVELRKGVYLATTGPSYETPAEVRFFRTVGADAIGMSTVPEVIAARHSGIKVFGMSCITNKSNIDNVATVLNDGQDVVDQANAAAETMSALFAKLISTLE